MLIPIGHDKGRRRLPMVTLAIIVICTALQVQRSIYAPAPEDVARKFVQREYYLSLVEQRLENDEVEFDAERLEKGDYGGIDDSYLADLRMADRELEDIKKADLSLRLGWSPDDGASYKLVTAAFLHGGWLHLIGNMLFLWLAGAAIEDRWGHLAFGLFYAGGAAVSAATWGWWNHGTHQVLVGASGAVAACMGAFLIVYARVNIRFVYWWYFRTGTFEARALYALPVWFAEEILYSLLEKSGVEGVAHSAHVGGFLFGMGVAAALKYGGFEQKLVLFDEMAEEVKTRHPELDEGLRHEVIGQKGPALAAFREVLAREPTHPTARSHALSLALDLKELEVARPLVSGGLVDMAKDGRLDELPAMLAKIDAAGLGGELADRSLAEVARLCLADEAHAPMGVQMVRRLLERPTPSPLLPGLVWRVAEVQAAAGRGDLAARALQMIVERFPMDPFADRARAKLASATPASGARAE